MSNWVTEELACKRCQAPITARRANTINMQRHPASRAEILDGSFHRVTCAACGHVAVFDTRMLFSDFPRGQFVEVRPAKELPQWAEHASSTVSIFADGLDQARGLGLVTHPRVRLVYGLDALADKLRAWDAGLDDRVVELAKLALVLEVAGGATPSSIYLVAVTGDLVFEMSTSGSTDRHALSRARYDEVAASATRDPASLDKLFDSPFVSWLRVYAG